MKRILIVMMLIAAVTANAQTATTETDEQRIASLQKAAEANPNDWQTQLELARIFLAEDSKHRNVSSAVKYYDRIFHYATDLNPAVPDSVLFESGLAVVANAFDKKDAKTAFSSLAAMDHFCRTSENANEKYAMVFDVWNYILGMATSYHSKALASLINIREMATDRNIPGREYTDAATALAYEMVMDDYKKQFSDKLMEITLDGKKYIFISMKEWNIEKPLFGFLSSSDSGSDTNGKNPTLLYGEDGKVYDDIHGDMTYDFICKKGSIEPNPKTNVRMITVTPEHRQQMVEAYRAYMSKK